MLKRLFAGLTLLSLMGLYACHHPEKIPGEKGNAQLVWSDETGQGRQVYLVFRKDFEAGQNAGGTISLFAWSRYHLNVNGVFVNFGPARSYPDSPEYDTYDLTPYLKEGHNFITVEVMNNGVYTYQVPEHNGLFISWGRVMSSSGSIGLATPGDWKVLKLKGYDATSPKMTFATGPLESYDARKDPAGWNGPSADTSQWQDAVVMRDQNQLGAFKTRSIPYLTQDAVVPESCKGIYVLKNDEDIYSFRVQASDSTRQAFNSNRIAFAYTWIWSPEDQKIGAGLWWGDFYVNGKGPLVRYTTDPDKFYRRDYTLDLRKGWNSFFVRYGIVWASWDFYMAVPRSAGLIFSPSRQKDSPDAFMAAGPFPPSEEQRAKDLDVPFRDPAAALDDFSVHWVPEPREKTAGNPAMEVAWSNFESPLPYAASKVSDIDIHRAGEGGTALIFDMGGKQLGRFFIDYDAPEGTIFDIAFTEDMNRNRPWILKRYGIYTATRTIAAGGKGHFETFKPYGLRYLQVNVRNGGGAVHIDKLGVVSQVYPYDKDGKLHVFRSHDEQDLGSRVENPQGLFRRYLHRYAISRARSLCR